MKTEAYIDRIVSAGAEACREQLMLEKNREKDEFSDKEALLFIHLNREKEELYKEIYETLKIDWRRVREEAGDVIAYAAAIADLANRRLNKLEEESGEN